MWSVLPGHTGVTSQRRWRPTGGAGKRPVIDVAAVEALVPWIRTGAADAAGVARHGRALQPLGSLQPSPASRQALDCLSMPRTRTDIRAHRIPLCSGACMCNVPPAHPGTPSHLTGTSATLASRTSSASTSRSPTTASWSAVATPVSTCVRRGADSVVWRRLLMTCAC